MPSLSCAPAPRRLGWLLVAALLGVTTPDASAQGYQSEEVDRSLRSRGAIVRRYAKNPTGEAQPFRDYIEKYFFPSMTQPTAEGLGALADSRETLFKSFLNGAEAQTQAYVNTQALEFSVRVLRGRYHPAVRYNALLILGALNDAYPTGDEDPTPSADANRFLCALADRGATNERLPAYQLAGALIGLERHTRYFGKLPGAAKSATARALYKVLSTDKLPNASPEVAGWMYQTTSAAVGNLGIPGPQGVFAKAIAKKAADDSLQLETRAAIASHLNSLNMKSDQVSGPAFAKVVSALAAEIAEAEKGYAEKFEDLQLRGGIRLDGAGRDKTGRRMRNNEEGEPVLVREGLLDELVDLRSAVRAVKAIADEAGQQQLATIDEAVTDAIRMVSDDGQIDLNVTDEIKRMAASIEQVTEADEALAANE